MPEEIYTPQQKATLEKGIQQMLSQGATEEDVMAYAAAYKQKYAVKKKESTGLPSKVGTSGLPKSKADAIADNKSLGTPTGEQFTYAPEAFSGNEVKYAPTSKANPPKAPQPIVKPKEEFEYYTPDIYADEVLYPKSQGVNPLTNKPNVPKDETVYAPSITNEEFNKRLSNVNTDLIDKSEEFVVPQLNYQFKDFGFKFEETGALGDAMIVTAPNGQTTTINLDPTLGRFTKLESNKLNKFLKENSLQYDKLNKIVSQSDNYNRTFNEQKDIDAAFTKIKQDQTDFAKSVQELYKLPKESEEYKTKLAELSKRQLQIENNKKELNKSVGQYVGMKSQQGQTSEYLWNQLLEGITGTASGLVGLSIDAFAPETMTNEEKKKAKNWIQPIIRESLDFAKSESTTKEYAQNTGFIEGAVGGLVKSIPAILSAEAMPLVMAGQISDDLDIEIDANPDFANISENEKLMLKAPLMIGGAVLETYGLRNAIGTKGLLNDLVANAISKSTKTTTAKSFKEFIEQDIENRLSKGLLKIGAGGLAEFETGASQELLDITTKDIYNAAKGKEMFQTPESLGEGAKQVIKAGLQEAIGGFILSTPSAFTKAKAKNDYTDVTDGQIEVLKALGNDVNVMDAIETNLQNQVATGDLTPKEAEEQLNDTRETVGLMNSMDTEGLSNEQIKESLPIVEEIKKLEKQKEGKVPIVKKVIQAQIDELNQKLLKATGQENILEPNNKEQDATEKRNVTESNLPKYQDGDKSGEKSKASDSNSVEQGGEVSETIAHTEITEEVKSYSPNNLTPLPKTANITSKDYWNKAAKRGLEDGNKVQDEINKLWTKKYNELKDAKKTDEFLNTDNKYQELLKKRSEYNKWRDDHYHAMEIRDALKSGFYEKAIEKGEITVNEAKSIIQSVGLEDPQEILNLSIKKTESKPLNQISNETKKAKTKQTNEANGKTKVLIEEPQSAVEQTAAEGVNLGGDTVGLKEMGVEIKEDKTSEGYYQVFKDGKLVGLLGKTDFVQANNKGQYFDESLMSNILTKLGKEHSKAERSVQGDNKFITIRIKNKSPKSQPQLKEQKPIVAETKQTESKSKAKPKKDVSKSSETIELEKQLDNAQKEVLALNDKTKTKSSEMGKTFMEDQSDLFGNRKSEKDKLFSQRVNPDNIKKVISELKAQRDIANKKVEDLKNKIESSLNKTETQQSLFGEIRKKTATSKPSKYNNLDELTPRTLLLRFFAAGGKVQVKEAVKRTSLGMKDLIGKVAKQGSTYHSLYENITDELGMDLGDIDQQDFDNMVDEMLSGSKADIFKEINEHLTSSDRAKEDPYNYTYEELQKLLKTVDPYYHDWIIEQIGEQERMIQDELTPKEAEELDRVIEKYTINGVIDWDAIANDKKVENTEERIFDYNKIFEEQPNIKSEQELIDEDREIAYQKSSFDKRWAKTYQEAKEKLIEQYNKAQKSKIELSSKTYKSAGGKSVFVGGELDGNNVSINSINAKRKSNAIKNAESEMNSAKEDLKALGLSNEEINNEINGKQDTKTESVIKGDSTSISKKEPIREQKEVNLPILNRLKEQYNQAEDDFRRNRVIDDFAYALAGDSNKSKRQIIMSTLKGEKVPVAKSGVNAIRDEFKKYLKNDLPKSSQNEIITEINSKPLTHAIGVNMGQNEMVGTYISTESENRYAESAKEVKNVEVTIRNPYLLESSDELIDLQNQALTKAKKAFEQEVEEFKTDKDFQDAETLDADGLTNAYLMGFGDFLAKEVTNNLKAKGYDSAYLRESKYDEGMLVVFDRKNVTFKDSNAPKGNAQQEKQNIITIEDYLSNETLSKTFIKKVLQWASVSRKFGKEPEIKDSKMIYKVATGEIYEMPLKEGNNIEQWREDYNTYIDGLKVGDTIKYKQYGNDNTGVIKKVNKNREGKISSVSTEKHTIASDRLRDEIYSPNGVLGGDIKAIGASWYNGLSKYTQPKYNEILLLSEKTAKQKNKERVAKAKEAFIKKGKNLQLGGLETLPEFTELVAAYIEMGYLSAKEILQQFREDLEGFDFDEKIATDKINEILAKEGIGTKSEPKEDSGKVEKTVSTKRVFKGTVREEIKKYIEDEGLYRDKFSFEQRSEQANKLIEDIGIDNAIEGVKNGDIRGALATAVITKAIKINDDEMAMLKATDVEELDVLGKRAADLIALLEQESYYGGEATGYLAYAYLNEDIGYNVEVKIKEYKAANNGEISPEVEQKFRDINKQLEEVNKKLLEAEARAKKAEEDNMIASIKESAAREKKKASTKIRKETDYIVQKIREGKTNRPSMFMSATPASLVWDGALETVASTIKATGRSVEAIAKGIEYIKSSDWYSSLSFDDKDEAIKQFQEYWKEGKKPKIVDGKIKIPQSLIRDLVEGGIDNIDDLVSEVMAMMQDEYPNVTERQIRDAISEYGKTKSYTKDDIAKQIRKIKHVGRIVSSLEDVAAKKRPLRSGLQRDKLDTEERALMKELREAMKELPIDVELEAEQMKTATDAAKTRLINQIEDLQREIDRKEQVPRKVRTIKDDQEIIELKAKRDAVKAEHEAIFKDEEYQLAKRLELTKKSAERRIEELKRRIAEGDFVKKVKKPIIADSELTKLRAQKIRLQSEYEKEIYKAKILNRTKAQKWKDGVWDAWGLLRLLQATGEFSFVGIQGLIYATSHPIQSARAFKKAIQLLFSESKTEKWLNEIKAQEYYPMVKASKLALSEPHAEITAREELFYSDSANSAWNLLGLGLRLKSKSAYDKWKDLSPFKGFERASVGYLDTIRLQRFLDGVEILKAKGIYFDENPKAYKELADVINTFTGRASIGAAEPIAPLLTKVFFSPRNWASMIKTATPYAFYHFGKMRAGGEGFKPTVQQKMALMDFSKFVGLTTSMVILAATYLNGDDDDETSVETDPRSSDFGKIKIGRTRVDPWGGRIQQIVLMSKFMMGEVKDKEGKIVPLGVPYKTPTRLGLIGQIAANKLSPSASLVKEYLSTRKDADGNTVTEYGEPYSIKDKFYEKLLPIYISTVKELLAEDPTALDGLLAFYAYFGGGVNVYDKPKENKKLIY